MRKPRLRGLKPHQHLGVARGGATLADTVSASEPSAELWRLDEEDDPYEYFKKDEEARLASAEAVEAQAAATASAAARRVRPRFPSVAEIAVMAGFHGGGHHLTELQDLWPQDAWWPWHDSDIRGFGSRLQGTKVS